MATAILNAEKEKTSVWTSVFSTFAGFFSAATAAAAKQMQFNLKMCAPVTGKPTDEAPKSRL